MMKRSNKMMVVAIALIVISALIIAPAAARYVIGTAPTGIQSGDTIFVYERNLDLLQLKTTSGNGDAVVSLRKFTDDDPTKGLVNEIPVANDRNFEVLASDVSGYYGIYYPYNGTALTRVGASDATARKTVTIRAPSLALDAVLNASHTDSVNGKSVADDTLLAFKVDAPFAGAFYNNATYNPNGMSNITIDITTPGGAVLNSFGGANLFRLNVSATQFFTDVGMNQNARVNAPVDLDGVGSGTYTAQAKWAAPQGFADYATKSNTVSFTVESRVTTLTANVDSIVRGPSKSFVITLSGKSNTKYFMYVKSAEATLNENPQVAPGQPGVVYDPTNRPGNVANAPGSTTNNIAIAQTYANVTTKADGTRNVAFNLTGNVKDKDFTIRVHRFSTTTNLDLTDYDEVKVKVEKGAVTITASGSGSYYLGEEILLSGTNTDTNRVYLFITGPNLETNGAQLDDPTTAVRNAIAWTFGTNASVRTDNTWERKWDTANAQLDAGSYTLYAVAAANNRNNLVDVQYATTSIVVKKPFVTATPSATTAAKGDKLFIRGNAEGNPASGIAVWIFGKNYFVRDTASVASDSSFEYEVTSAWTRNRASGQYFVVVQHPMYNGVFDVRSIVDTTPGFVGTWVNTTGAAATANPTTDAFKVEGAGRLQGSDAAEALIQLMNNPNVDDTYTKLTFLVEEPWIRIDTVGDKYVGSQFTITGTTNLAVDNDFLVDVISSSFKPTEKTQAGEFAGQSGVIKVVKGDAGYNTWSFAVDATAFQPDEYIINVESIEAQTTTTATFNVLEGVPVTQPPATQPPATQPPATTPPTEVPATPASPGFGALVAIAGLGAVAFLVLRRD